MRRLWSKLLKRLKRKKKIVIPGKPIQIPKGILMETRSNKEGVGK